MEKLSGWNNLIQKWKKVFTLKTLKINFKGPFLIDNKLILFSSNRYLNMIDSLNGKF